MTASLTQKTTEAHNRSLEKKITDLMIFEIFDFANAFKK